MGAGLCAHRAARREGAVCALGHVVNSGAAALGMHRPVNCERLAPMLTVASRNHPPPQWDYTRIKVEELPEAAMLRRLQAAAAAAGSGDMTGRLGDLERQVRWRRMRAPRRPVKCLPLLPSSRGSQPRVPGNHVRCHAAAISPCAGEGGGCGDAHHGAHHGPVQPAAAHRLPRRRCRAGGRVSGAARRAGAPQSTPLPSTQRLRACRAAGFPLLLAAPFSAPFSRCL